MARQKLLVDKNNIVINPYYKQNMVEGTRNHIGYAVVKTAFGERAVFKKGDQVVIWEHNGKLRAFSVKHAHKKAVKHITLAEIFRFISGKNIGANSDGKILNYPCNQRFLKTRNLKQGAICLILYWRHCFNPYLKVCDIEQKINL